MFCPGCGNQLPDGAKFCGKCGTAIAVSTQQRPQAAQAQSPVAAQPQPAAAAWPQAAQPAFRAVPVTATGSQAPIIANAPFLTMKNVGYIELAACILGIVGFFLPFANASFYGYEMSMSGFQMVTGIDILGSSYGGDASNLLIVIPYVVGLAVALGVKGKARWIVGIVCGALQLLLMIYFNAYISDISISVGSYSLGIGYWLLTLGAVLLLAAGVLGFMGTRKGLA